MSEPSSQLLREIEDGIIDVTEWLPRHDVSSLLPCNADLQIERHEDGRLRSAIRRPMTLMYWMRAVGILENKHVWEGETYALWREVMSATFGNKRNRSPSNGESIGGLNEYSYVLLLRRLPRSYQLHIEYSLDTVGTDHQREIVKRVPKPYQSAFNRLVALVEEIREEVKALPPSREHRWKNLVDDIKNQA